MHSNRTILVDHNDVMMVRLWLWSLTKISYQFPSMVSLNSIPKYTTYDTGVYSTLGKIFHTIFKQIGTP